MNGKLSRALRHSREGKVTGRDIEILKRYYERDIANTQFIKPLKVRARKFPTYSPISWPRTDDQKKQSRPVIVEHPMRHIEIKLKTDGLTIKRMTGGHLPSMRHASVAPKHLLDALAA